MLDIAGRYPRYILFRQFGYPRIGPLSLAVSVTHRCNARCMTCRVTKRRPDELSVREYDAVFRSLRGSPRWATITGGEPFMRADLAEIVHSLIHNAKPDAITIATNASLGGRAAAFVRSVVKEHPETAFIMNISIDGIGPAHDKIRGLPDSFQIALDTFHALKNMEIKNLRLGFHTVISRFNVHAIPDLIEYLKTFEPDHHHFEIAQTRAELNIDEKDIAPDLEQYESVVGRILEIPNNKAEDLFTEIMQSFRKEYYRLSLDILKKKEQVIPCFAGIASVHIAPNGDVWPCSVLARSIGNLREKKYNFQSVWESARAEQARRFIKQGRCCCPMANACYSNLLLHMGSITRMLGRYLVKF